MCCQMCTVRRLLVVAGLIVAVVVGYAAADRYLRHGTT